MSSRRGGRKKKKDGSTVIAENRKARFNYELLEFFEAGIVLLGTEVKSLREGKANIAESYVSPEDNELFLINANIDEYKMGNRNNHEPRRRRKLLMKRREINRLAAAREREGLTIVPVKMYFNERGRVKLALALARGKKLHDKRETEKKRDWQRQKSRLMKDFG